MTQTQSRNAEEKKTITLDSYGAQDIIDAIESLVMTEICLKNNMPTCGRYKSARIVLGRNYVKFLSKKSLITLFGGELLIIRSKNHKLIVYGDDVFFRLFRGERLIAKGRRLTWDGTEEIFTPQELFRFIQRTIRSILDAGWF